MKATRKRHDAEFKARVAIEALKGIQTIQQIAKDFQLHPVQVSEWKKVMITRASEIFKQGSNKSSEMGDYQRERALLHAKIGEQAVSLDFLTKKSKQLGL